MVHVFVITRVRVCFAIHLPIIDVRYYDGYVLNERINCIYVTILVVVL